MAPTLWSEKATSLLKLLLDRGYLIIDKNVTDAYGWTMCDKWEVAVKDSKKERQSYKE